VNKLQKIKISYQHISALVLLSSSISFYTCLLTCLHHFSQLSTSPLLLIYTMESRFSRFHLVALNIVLIILSVVCVASLIRLQVQIPAMEESVQQNIFATKRSIIASQTQTVLRWANAISSQLNNTAASFSKYLTKEDISDLVKKLVNPY